LVGDRRAWSFGSAACTGGPAPYPQGMPDGCLQAAQGKPKLERPTG
jgi:hypothetical protein